jgi:hypothetical protein
VSSNLAAPTNKPLKHNHISMLVNALLPRLVASEAMWKQERCGSLHGLEIDYRFCFERRNQHYLSSRGKCGGPLAKGAAL